MPTPTPGSVTPDETEEYDKWLAKLARECRDGCGINCGDRPCGGCMQGSVCDNSMCRCDGDDLYDEETDE